MWAPTGLGVHLGMWGAVVCVCLSLSVHGDVCAWGVGMFVYKHEEAARVCLSIWGRTCMFSPKKKIRKVNMRGDGRVNCVGAILS